MLFLQQMKIEEAIKQKRFKNEKVKASIYIIYTANWLQDVMRQFFDRYDLSNQQYNVLRILRGQYPVAISTCDIRSRMLDKMSDVSRIVARLSTAGLVTQKSNAKDKRLVDVKISAKGLRLLETIDHDMEEMETVMNGITNAEAKQLNDILDKLKSNKY